MEISLQIFLICLALGAVVGFLAGLLGIGGGLVIVPVLILLLPLTGIEPQYLMPVVLATSLAAIVLTAISTLLTHYRKRNIPRFFMPQLLGGVGLGGLAGGYFADVIPSDYLQVFFAVFAMLMAIQMWIGAKKSEVVFVEQPEYSSFKLVVICFGIGVIASLLGIGGGVLLVPFLTSQVKLDMRRAIGASAAVGFVVAAMGSIGYLSAGLSSQASLPQWTLGYVYLPALLGIISLSLLAAPFGVSVAQRMPVKVLKRCFSILLFIVAAEIIFS